MVDNYLPFYHPAERPQSFGAKEAGWTLDASSGPGAWGFNDNAPAPLRPSWVSDGRRDRRDTGRMVPLVSSVHTKTQKASSAGRGSDPALQNPPAAQATSLFRHRPQGASALSVKNSAAGLALVATIAAPVTAWAWGVPGCPNLPAYNRALGTLQGLTTCGMTLEEARRVIAAHDGPGAAEQQVAPAPRAHQRRPLRPRHHRAAR